MRLFPVSKGRADKRRGGLTAHGSPTRQTYNIWINMVHRCHDTDRDDYPSYGGRGIRVCGRWLVFDLFLTDMGICPGKGWSIDRINNTKGYEPGNCRWATAKMQMRNVTYNRLLTVNGVTKCTAEWAEVTGLSPQTISARINKLKWPADLAVGLPATRSMPKSEKGRRALLDALQKTT